MVCSSNLIYGDLNNLSNNGTLHIQQNKNPPTDSTRLKYLQRNSEKLSWSQTKALKMSKPGSSWDNQRKSSENQGLFASLIDDDDEILSTEDKNMDQEVKDNEIEEIKIVNYYSKKDSSVIHNVAKDIPLRNTAAYPNMMNYQPIYYNNPTSILQKLPQAYNNPNPNNNNPSPKKVVRFQEADSDIQVLDTKINESTFNKRETVVNAPLPIKQHVDMSHVYNKSLPNAPRVAMNTVYNAMLDSKHNINITPVSNRSLTNAPYVPMTIVHNAPLPSKPVAVTSVYNAPLPSKHVAITSILNAPLPSKPVDITSVYRAPLPGAPHIAMNNVHNAPLLSAPHIAMNNVHNAPLFSAPHIAMNTVHNAPLPSAPHVATTSQTTKNQLIEHMRHKRISEAIEAAIASPANRLPQPYAGNKTHNTVMSNWSISQKLDHKTHEIMPLKLKLKKNTKTKPRNKQKQNAPIDGSKKKHGHNGDHTEPNSKRSKKEISFLDLPEDGNYLIVRKIIEECPMCYAKLNIRKCAVHLKLLLYTYHCDCGLTIFHIPHTPDNIPHPIKIIEK